MFRKGFVFKLDHKHNQNILVLRPSKKGLFQRAVELKGSLTEITPSYFGSYLGSHRPYCFTSNDIILEI